MPSAPAIATELARLIAAGYPFAPAAESLPLTVQVWQEVLADLTDAELHTACTAYLRSPDPAWPVPSKIRALAPVGRAAALLGSPTDADRAFADFVTRMVRLGMAPDPDVPKRHLDPEDPYRNAAMFAGLAAIGGDRGWGRSPTAQEDPIGAAAVRRSWCAAYTATRVQQRQDPDALRLTAHTTLELTDGRH